MEKMSVLKPAAKQPRTKLQMQSPLQRTESTDLSLVEQEEERNRRTASLPTSLRRSSSTVIETTQTEKHPKGHKVRNLSSIWESLDKSEFLKISDTLLLEDVWTQPTLVYDSSKSVALVQMRQIVDAPHIKWRDTRAKLSVDDLLKILYLNDCVQFDLQNVERLSFDDWMKEKSALCVKSKGMEEGSDRAKLCNFIITEDRSFTFYPHCLNGRFGMFFRKICCHSYKTSDATKIKIPNPSMIKGKGMKGSFEYVIEARLFPLPDEWFDHTNPGSTSMVDKCLPDTQPF